MKTLIIRGLAAALCVMTCGTKADAEIIQYLVEFAQSGDVTIGSTLDWTLSVVVSDSDANNFGVRTAAVDLVNSTGEAMTPGTLALPFGFFGVTNGGTVVAGGLDDVGAGQVTYNPLLVVGEDGNLGPHVLATGSYTVNTLGLHTLSTMMAASNSSYYTAADTTMFADYDSQLFSSDFVNVVAMAGVPEPASMLLASTLIVPGVIGVRRRRRQRTADKNA